MKSNTAGNEMDGERSRYHHGDLENAIVETATEMLEESGVMKISMREIAKKIGVSHQAPYKHFSSKADVLLAIRARGFAELASATRDASLKHPRSVRLQLEAAASSYVSHAIERPANYQLMFGGEWLDESQREEQKSCSVEAFEALAGIFQPEGPPFDAKTLDQARLFWATMHGIASLRINGFLAHDHSSLQNMTKSACRMFSLSR